MGTIHYDKRFAPVYVVSFEGTPTKTEFEAYLAFLSDVLRRGEKYAVIVDASKSSGLPRELRRLQSAWIKSNLQTINRLCLGTAFVIVRSFVHRILASILLRQPLSTPRFITGDLASAVMWTAERLQHADVVLPLGLMTQTAVSRPA